MTWVLDDGGRRAAGFRGIGGDCVCRAIAIATELPYPHVYRHLTGLNLEVGKRYAGHGVCDAQYGPWLEELGWAWCPIGAATRVRFRAGELPGGRLLVKKRRHLAAMVDGVVHDAYDSTRDGSAFVVGYWSLR